MVVCGDAEEAFLLQELDPLLWLLVELFCTSDQQLGRKRGGIRDMPGDQWNPAVSRPTFFLVRISNSS